ncbi:MAG: response regulator transcription factor [Lachnospiraceae bacterium]|nr:response regulator transcription factor [Lachnospiraceae bacterium]
MDRILIIEDDEAIAELERDYLELSGFSVNICTNGNDGLQEGLRGDYSLVILDVMLPGVDGYDILRQIRQIKDIPIIMVSAKKEDVDKIHALGLGADDYMTKPFSPSELTARVRAHLSRYDRLTSGREELPARDHVLEIRGLRIEKESRRVYVDGKEKNLTTKEFDLLTFLAEHPNRVFSKEELFKQIWGMDSIGDIATVTVHIRKIREKIEFDSAKPQYIETRWGVGYSFRV